MFEIRDIEVFKAVVEHGGFRAASTRLRLAQSAVSERVAALEYRLGFRLVVRSGRTAKLTPAGRRFLEETTKVLVMRDRIVATFARDGAIAGTIRIGVAETIVHTWLPHLLTLLKERIPRLRIEISVDLSTILAEKITSGDIDVAILMRELVPAIAHVEPIFKTAMEWVASPDLDVTKREMTIEDFARLSIVTFPKSSIPYHQVERIMTSRLNNPPLLHGCASLSTALHLARTGFGVGTLPTSFIAQDVDSERLIRLNVEAAARLKSLTFSLCHIDTIGTHLANDIITAAHEAVENFNDL